MWLGAEIAQLVVEDESVHQVVGAERRFHRRRQRGRIAVRIDDAEVAGAMLRHWRGDGRRCAEVPGLALPMLCCGEISAARAAK